MTIQWIIAIILWTIAIVIILTEPPREKPKRTVVKYMPIRGPLEKFPATNVYDYPYTDTFPVEIEER